MANGGTRRLSMKFKHSGSVLANPWFALILIAATVLVIYSNTYSVPFVFDGKVQIENKEKIRDLENYVSLKGLKTHRPIVEFSFALNYQFGKLNPVGYHLVNILIHLTNGVLVYFLALNVLGRLSLFQGEQSEPPVASQAHRKRKKRIRKPTPPTQKSNAMVFSSSKIPSMSLWVALLFVAHPIQTQAVTYIVQRYASMSAMFYLASVLLYIQARNLQLNMEGLGGNDSLKPDADKKSAAAFSFKIPFYFAATVLSGVFAFLSKENAATLPGIILLVEYFLFDRSWQGWKKKLIRLVPLGALLTFLALYFLSSMRGLKFENLLEDVSILTRETGTVDRWSYFCTQFNVLVEYIRLLFFPFGQNVDHMVPLKAGFFDGLTPLAFVFVMAVILVGIWNIRKRPAVSFGIFWFFITLSIESSIFPISDAMFEHRLYLPVFGFAVSVVYVVFQLFSNKRVWANLLLATAIVALGMGTYLRNKVWQDPLSLWKDSARKNPENHRAHNNFGAELNDVGYLGPAIREYSKALEIKPDFADANNNLGNALIRQGQLEEAIQCFSKALQKKPRLVGALNNMGVALAQKGDLDDAIRYFKKALGVNPLYAGAHNSLGNALAQKGRVEEAMLEWTKAAEINPAYANPHYNMGVVFEQKGDMREAERCFSEAVRLNPHYAQAYSKLGFISVRQGDYKSAMRLFSKALEINPRLADAQRGFRKMTRLIGKGN
ncbi:MAG: tetratricopeptide repeat protein [Deltaproteobacteria bacterium]|nr:tetratricopeptide repeat protein [Deltaproteobacteria bacterium]